MSRRAVLSQLPSPLSTRSSGMHAGLWMDKLLVRLSPSDHDAKSAHIAALAAIPVPAGYLDALHARTAALGELKAMALDVRVNGALVVGLGFRGTMEVGLSLEHTWGVPVIPGSTLKGITKAACASVESRGWEPPSDDADASRDGGEYYRALFGTSFDGVGAVSFHDAWWVPKEPNERLPIYGDIMTPHHRRYYDGLVASPLSPSYAAEGRPLSQMEKDGEKSRYAVVRDAQRGDDTPPRYLRYPDGTEDPFPVPFAVVANARFRIWLTGNDDWCSAAQQLLLHGITTLGVGAKVNAGYGRLSEVVAQGRPSSAG